MNHFFFAPKRDDEHTKKLIEINNITNKFIAPLSNLSQTQLNVNHDNRLNVHRLKKIRIFEVIIRRQILIPHFVVITTYMTL